MAFSKGGVAAANFLTVAHREPSLGNTWGDMLAKSTDGRRTDARAIGEKQVSACS